MNNIIEVKNLNKTFKIEIKKQWFINRIKWLFKPIYKEVMAVNNINFTIKKGEKVAFIWPNGAGKSTTIKMMTWILTKTTGEMSIMGLDPTKERKKLVYRIGAVFWQTSRLRYHLTPKDTFLLMGKLFDIPKDVLKKRLSYLNNKFEIQELIDVPVRKMSLWQRMRCEIVASLIHSPDIIFLDEPTIGLDIIAKQKLREIINEINSTEKTTIFLTSHDLWDIEQVCDRVIIINHGIILYDWWLDELRKNYIKKKIIKANLVGTADFEPLDFMDMKKKEMDYITFEIPNNKNNLQKTFELLTTKYEVEDIEIKDPNIETIIKEFY